MLRFATIIKGLVMRNSPIAIMNVFILTTLLILGFAVDSTACAVILVAIRTTSESVTYSINNEKMTVAELSDWLRRGIEAFGNEEAILIQPDSHTTFLTLFTLLERLAASGAKHFEIVAERAQTANGSKRRSLTLDSDQLKSVVIPSEPPKK